MDDKKKDKPAATTDKNEGEGSKSADERYRKNVDEFLDKEDPAKLARQAANDIEKDPKKYSDAEKAGKGRIAEEDPKDKELI